MSDPLFGVEYQRSEVHFENAPKEVFRCKDLKSPRRELDLFGTYTKGKLSFYYVYGLVEVDWGGSSNVVRRFEAESDDGIIVVISPSGCRNIGAGYAWSSDKRFRQQAEKYGITDDVVSSLLTDAFDREVKTFGGAANFLRKIDASGVDESKLPPKLREELTDLRKKTREKMP
jgi:hypothetical protein